MIEGRIQTRSWDAQDGTKKYRTEIVAEALQMGPRQSGGGYQNEEGSGSSRPATQKEEHDVPPQELETVEYPVDEINPEDIPF